MAATPESLWQKPDDSEEPELKEQPSGVVLPFPKKTQKYPEYKKSIETALEYREYRELGGILTQTEYEDVLERAASGAAAAEAKWGKYVRPMTDAARITFSPGVATLYAILRDTKQTPEEVSYANQSDHVLLAEALRIIGDQHSLAIFLKSRPPN